MKRISSGCGRPEFSCKRVEYQVVASTTYRSREDAASRMGFTLDRKAVAAFMLDAIEQMKHLQKIGGIAK